MTKEAAEETNQSLYAKRYKKTAKWFLLFLFVLVFGLPVSALFNLLMFYLGEVKEDIGWKRIYVDSSEQVQTFSTGKQTVELRVGTYSRVEDGDEVDIEVFSNGTLMPTLSHTDYDHWLSSEPSPGVYRLKDVDGDRTKDFVIRTGSSESDHKFYYVSSQDGKGYQTDKRFQSSRPWTASELR